MAPGSENSQENDILRTVLEDVLFFQKTWTHRCDPVSVRNGAAVLRRLFSEGLFVRAWRLSGLSGHPNIMAPSIDDMLNDESIWWALAGGGICHGLSMQRYVARFKGDGLVSIGGEASIYGRPFLVSTSRGIEPIPVKDYLSSASAILDSTKITRADIIKFMANKAGGVHLDTRDDDSPALAALRKRRALIGIQEHDGLSFEVLSIGQCLAWSPETQQFIVAARGKLGIPPPMTSP